ncbi:hypothetical protein IW261DRAFT_1524318 [Armillaria novae-zelandiae]|uniref:NACHT domain-containing protein n=1 Tax=Armillaria novae-zelandiae TaxID=153914 RepID=A0AA39T4J3_9AGAR|nr:hypothetical protein IW261DRAFT_1524318 [Armillaria novae-zelandiae]
MAEDTRFRFIEDVELQWLLFTDVARIYLTVAAGDVSHTTNPVKYRAYFHSESKTIWSPQLNLGHLDASTTVTLKLYSSRKILGRKLLGSAQLPVGDMFAPNQKDEPLLLLGRASPAVPTVSLKIVYSSDPQEVVRDLVNNVSRPKAPLAKYSKILDGVVAIKETIDLVTEFNPVAKMAWVIISMGVDILRKQKDADELIVELYETMLLSHKEASGDEFLKCLVVFRPIYDSLLDHTIACAQFIENCAKKNLINRIAKGHFTKESKKMQERFHEIDEKLAWSVTKGSYKLIADQDKLTQIKEAKDSLKPSSIPDPELLNFCLDGTREQVLKSMEDWILKCNGGSLWCTGMAGMGKSSLMATLCKRLGVNSDGNRSQLGCFIRYDRKTYTDTSQLVSTIAYSLCVLDEGIAGAISEAVRIRGLSVSETQDKFRILLREPLASVQLDKRRPIVIIVDGLDECDVTKLEDILKVLAEGFGPNLPFMRLIVSCRPIDCVSRTLLRARAQSNSKLVNICLDDKLYRDQAVDDIQLYIRHRFSEIYSFTRLRDGTDEFRNLCESLQAAEKLSCRAEGLFIWAATVCKFLAIYPFESRIQQLLEAVAPKNALHAMTSLYLTALRAVVSEDPQDTDITSYIRAVLGALIVATVITVEILNDLVFPNDRSANLILAKLGSVVHTNQQGYIHLVHQSFYDFLKDRDRCEEWYIDPASEEQRDLEERINSLPHYNTRSSGVF